MQNHGELSTRWADFIATGDENAFYMLYEHYHDYLLYIAAVKGVEIDGAKDHVNDLFLYIFENRSRLDHIKNYHNYIVTSFIRKIFHKGHFNNLIPLSIEEDGCPAGSFDISTDDLRFYDNEEVSLALNTCINMLSRSQAKIIYQKFYLGLSYEVIADFNGVPVKTIYNTVFRATARLKKLMQTRDYSQLKAAILAFAMLLLVHTIYCLQR
jgi:RNA polymerase sigma factor (sigma-70 family)